jgi:uncharacterized protein (TIGR02145 family)
VKQIFTLTLLIQLLIVGCKKDDDRKTIPVTGSVNIEGQVYSTVVIGRQEWTSVNYAGPGGRNAPGSTDLPSNVGRYYKLADLSALILPTGWRIPTHQDFIQLMSNFSTEKNAAGDQVISDREQARKLMSAKDWYQFNGTNASGFNALPLGNYIDGSNGINFYADRAYFLTATLSGESNNLNSAFLIMDDLNFENPFRGWYARLVKQREGIDLHFQSVRFVRDF